LGIFAVSVLSLIIVLFFIVYAAQSHRAYKGQVTLVSEYGKSRNVDVNASCPGDLFVPTNTSGEYDSFLSGASTISCGVSLTVRPSCNLSAGGDYACSGSLTFVGAEAYFNDPNPPDYTEFPASNAINACNAYGPSGSTCCEVYLDGCGGNPYCAFYNFYTSFGSPYYVGIGSNLVSGTCTSN